MERWVGKVALVTGASTGIGAGITELLVKNGMKVVGCAREVSRIEELQDKLKGEKGSLLALRCDVTKPDEIINVFRTINKDLGQLHVCINNAGLCQNAPLLSGDTEMFRNMLEVNVLALAVCTREAYKLMQESGVDDGHIINISSMSGHRIYASAASHFYSATKYAVTALTEGTRNELRAKSSKIRVSQISPGLVATEFQYRMLGEEIAKRTYSSIQCLEASDIAETVVYILGAPPHVQVGDVLVRPTEQVY